MVLIQFIIDIKRKIIIDRNEALWVQYELVWKNIEYLDNNILKIVGLYGVLGAECQI